MIQSIRGMNDILPEQTSAWQYLESIVKELIQSYGYQEIRIPFLENTALFKRAIGEVTDIVEKEMYTFLDRNGESLSLRPEGTAGCLRACIQHNLLYNQTQRLWYSGPMFRYERPQKGRYRQFYQLGVEAYGFSNSDIELEILLMSTRLWKILDLQQSIKLEINTLGTLEERHIYRQILINYFKQHLDILDQDSLKRLETNPLRILDSKNPNMQAMIEKAPRLLDHLQDDSKKRFDNLCQQLEKAGVPFRINTRLVRGLDYYSHTVFEWVTHDLGAQGTVCAGGRYDALVTQLDGPPTPAFGFGLGIERLLLLLEEKASFTNNLPKPADIYVIFIGERAEEEGRLLIETWRDHLPFFRIITHCGQGSMKSQWKKADKSGALIALVLGDEEMQRKHLSIKFLREERSQIEVSQENLVAFLKEYFSISGKK